MTLNWIEIVKQTKRSERYWKPRLQNPLHKAYNENEESLKAWLSFYEDAKKDIDSELLDVYKKIGKDEPLISDFYRKNHLQQIEKQIEKTVLAIGKKEELYTKGRIKHGISLGTQTVSEVLGTPLLNQRAIDELIKRPWAEGDFSSRIWDNKAQLIASMKSELTAGIVKGDGIYKVADRLDARMNVGRSDTQRLVRTEYMHALNAGQIETYKANGVKQVEWVATMDNAGCDTCKSRNHKVYDIDQIPHPHPNCRCTTIPHITQEMIDAQAKKLEDARKNVEKASQAKSSTAEFSAAITDQMNDKERAFYENLLNNAPDEIKDVWARMKDKVQLVNQGAGRGAAGSTSGTSVTMKLSSDMKDMKYSKAGNTFFHEMGHAFDHAVSDGALLDQSMTATTTLSNGKTFGQTIYDEVQDRIKKIRKEQKIKARDAKSALHHLLEDDVTDNDKNMLSVIDLYGGSTNGYMRINKLGHEGSYWSPRKTKYRTQTKEGKEVFRNNRLGSEGFAEFIAAHTMDPEELKYLKKWLPESYKAYLELLKHIK